VSVPTTARRGTATKVIGSVGVLAAAAAVAGLGTFGSFTDSTTPVTGAIDTGTVSIDLAAPAQSIDFPEVAGGWVPGDRSSVALDLLNTGTVALGSLTVDITAPQSSILDTDTTHGLQLTLDACDQAWAVAGGAYSCAGTVTRHYAGPVVVSAELPRAASMAVGGVDHLLATATLPQAAGNEFMDASSELSIVITATQRGGTAR
jgi:hypothetical protein